MKLLDVRDKLAVQLGARAVRTPGRGGAIGSYKSVRQYSLGLDGRFAGFKACSEEGKLPHTFIFFNRRVSVISDRKFSLNLNQPPTDI